MCGRGARHRASRKECSTSCCTSKALRRPSSLVSNMSKLRRGVGAGIETGTGEAVARSSYYAGEKPYKY